MKNTEDIEEEILTLQVVVHALLHRAGFTRDQSLGFLAFARKTARRIKRDERMAEMGYKFTPEGGVTPIEERPAEEEDELDYATFEAAFQASEKAKADSATEAPQESEATPDLPPRGSGSQLRGHVVGHRALAGAIERVLGIPRLAACPRETTFDADHLQPSQRGRFRRHSICATDSEPSRQQLRVRRGG